MNDHINPAIDSIGLELVKLENDLDYKVMDTRLTPPRHIGYVSMVLLADAFRVNFVPKGYKHFSEIQELLDSCLHAHVARDMRARSLFKRIFFCIPFN